MPQIENKQNERLLEPGRFGIPAHIHVCVTGTGSVILDVKRDKYLGLGREETQLLSRAVTGWPSPLWPTSTSCDANASTRATNDLCEVLVADGVLDWTGDTKKEKASCSSKRHARWSGFRSEMNLR